MMTNEEYIFKKLDKFHVTQNDVDVILADGGLNGKEFHNAKACVRAILKDFYIVRAAAHQNVTEGGYSVSWNDCEAALKDFEDALNDELDDKNDRIGNYGCIDRSYMW